MAKNQPIEDGYKIGAVKNRTQVYNQTTDLWIKRGHDGRFMDCKNICDKFKGVRRVNNC